MPLEKRSFMGGMNKDGDVRLIKNPDYIDALNVRAATSVDGTVGSLENIEGNVEVPFEFYSTASETFFVNDNGLYEEINAATVFYQKVIRIQGWEQNNSSYNFSLFSVGPNGNILVGEFNWSGNTGNTFTSFYLNSQFSSVGPYNSSINVYDINTGDQYTASVKLLSFGQNAMLHGGYFDVVIECDVAGVNFDLSVSSNVDSDDLIYTYSQEQNGIPITASENLSIFLLPGFDTGGVYNSDANDDGIVISPNGTFYEVGNRTVWRIVIQGQQPTSSPADFDPITIFSFRENLNPAQPDNAQQDYESLPFLTIDQGTFSSGDYEFDSNQNSLSAFFHNEFSEDKSVLCDGLPLTFTIPAENFFLTFSENATFDGTNDFSIIIVGPVGVKFKLALADSSETLNTAFANGNVMMGNGAADFSAIFNNGCFISLGNYQIVENSIEITSSILNSFTALQEELDYQIELFYDLQLFSIQQTINNNTLEADIETQIGLTDVALAELTETEASLALANQSLDDQVTIINDLTQANTFLEDQNDDLSVQLDNLDTGLGELLISISNLNYSTVPSVDGSSSFNSLAADVISLISQVNLFQTTQSSFIDDFNDTFEEHLLAAGLPLVTDFINLIISVEDIISNITDTLSQQTADAVAGYIQEIANINADHVVTVTNLENASDEELEGANNLYILNLNTQEEYYLDLIEGLEDDAEIDEEIITELNNDVFVLESEVNNLVDQLNQLRISDAIIVAKLNEYNDIYTSINNSYINSLAIYDDLNIVNAVIYHPSMGDVNTFQGDFLLYEGLFSDGYNINILSSFDASSNIVNPAGYENNGYLSLPLSSDNYTAARLPYSSFDNQGAWQNGNEITIMMMFQVVDVNTGTGSANIPSNLNVAITNMWDDNDIWDTNNYGFEISHSVISNGNLSPSVFEHTFTIVDNNENNFLDTWANITILIPSINGGVSDFEIRLSHIRIGNDAQEAISFNLNNQVPTAENLYLERYSEVNTQILNWQSSEFDTLSEFMSEASYNSILNKLITGYSDNPNLSSNYTIGGRLQSYANAVFAFSNSVQEQIYSQYLLYFQASQAAPEDLTAIQEQHQAEVADIQGSLDIAVEEIETLESQLEFIQENSGTFLTGPNISATLLTLYGSNTTSISTGLYPFSPYANGTDLTFQIQYLIDGSTESVNDFVFLTSEECYSLAFHPYSETNNLVYYLTNRFQNGQTIDFELPEVYGYPTQKLVCLFVNFDEGTNAQDPPYLGVVNGINISVTPWSEIYSSPGELYQHKDLQMIFYFDQTLFDNIPATENVSIKGVYGGGFGTLIASDFDDDKLYADLQIYSAVSF
tara:strand:+ start:3827 stop:7825 length:3999 start_codon:yes stop_codon:yes gene_type:complete